MTIDREQFEQMISVLQASESIEDLKKSFESILRSIFEEISQHDRSVELLQEKFASMSRSLKSDFDGEFY